MVLFILKKKFNKEEIIKTIYNSCYISIVENKLEVIINDNEINSKT